MLFPRSKSGISSLSFPLLILLLALADSPRVLGDQQPSAPKSAATVISPVFSSNPTPEEIFRARVFAEPLVPIGVKPTAAENSDLATALLGYAKRSSPDDFSSLTRFLDQHPQSPWVAALLTDLGLEYYNTAHYSLAINAWSNAWALSKNASDRKAIALVDRAFGELIQMDARLGRMDELTNLLKSVENKHLMGPAAERTVLAREALWSMQNHPEISFRCGPLALRSVQLELNLHGSNDVEILKSASTQQGCSLPQVAELSKRIGLNYQMAYRQGGDFITPSVVHWKVGHYAALIRHGGNLYELQDPTFGNKTWATKEALDAETSGYFLIPAGPLPSGWRAVDSKEGGAVWGKGMTGANDPQHIAKNDLATGGTCPGNGIGMAVSKVHLMDVNLDLSDTPVGYAPPVGPPVYFTIRYNQRDVFQPANFTYGNLGPQWTSDWFSYITDNPSNTLADVNLYVGGGGQRTYIGFNTNTQSYNYQQYDHNLLTRTGPASYQLLSGDGSRMIFSKSDGSVGTSRNIFLTQVIDPQNNAVTLTYDTNFCLVAITDAIGQVTTLTYGLASTNVGSGQDASTVPADPYKLTKVTDPFGRSAVFNYQPQLVEIQYGYFNGQPIVLGSSYAWEGIASSTDVIGITSQFGYQPIGVPVNQFQTFFTSYVNSLTTPYGTTSFFPGNSGNVRSLEISYPDGSKERVEYNQTNLNQVMSDPVASLPTGMYLFNDNLRYRDSYYWDRTACAQAYGDYSKARMFHFLHKEDLATTSGALESVKMPLEGRVWYNYPGQNGTAYIIGSSTLPSAIGRVLDDGSTQLFTYAYNPFGHLTNCVDPAGRTLSLIYDTNGIDLLEVRQTRAGNNELLAKMTYNSQHRPLTATDASGQTTTYTFNARSQVLTVTNPRNETTAFTYDTNGYLLAVDGPLPGTVDKATLSYDGYGRVGTATTVSGDTYTLYYDNLDRITQVTYPDGTSSQTTYDLLNLAEFRDRAGRLTVFEHDNMRQMTSITDAQGRTTKFEWCRCGSPKSMIDPMGRMTSWSTDVQGRRTAKQYSDGTQIRYLYESVGSRLQEVIDENQQTTFYTYKDDGSLASISYGNTAIATPSVSFTYDPNYLRLLAITDGVGTTKYSYLPIGAPPILGAGNLASVDGPLTNDSIAYTYDELGRAVQTSINGVSVLDSYDTAGRVINKTNSLGAFSFSYDGGTGRLLSKSQPNGLTTSYAYGDGLDDRRLQEITHTNGATPVSQFRYVRKNATRQITSWSQQADSQTPSVFSFGYDSADQLLSVLVTNGGALVNTFGYTYDPAGNRLTEQLGASNSSAAYNALNQISTTTAHGASRTNEWDAVHRLTAVNLGNARTEFTYDGMSRLVAIRKLVSGSEVSFRRFVWCGERICEERDASGANVTKRYFAQGMKLETGPLAGNYYYTRDHLGSIREVTDASGAVRARYSYDPFGRRIKVSGDVDADFGFAGMFFSPEVSLAFTHFRAYDPEIGRWSSRDPLGNAEFRQGPNLYAYVGNGPVDHTDPSGLLNGEKLAENGLIITTVATTAYYIVPALNTVDATCIRNPVLCVEAGLLAAGGGGALASGAGDTLEMPAVNCEAPTATLANEISANPSAETLSTAVEEGDIPPEVEIDVEARAADLKETYEEIQPNMDSEMEAHIEQQRQDWEGLNDYSKKMAGGVPLSIWTEDMIMLDRVFNNLAQAYARQNGVSPDKGWAAIVRMTGFNPDNW